MTKVNTTKSVRALRPGEEPNAPRYEPPTEGSTGNIVTTKLYDEMPDQDDPEPLQGLPADGYFAVLDAPGSGLEIRPLAGLIVLSDGSLYATVGEDEMLDEVRGFVGVILCRDRSRLRTDEDVLELLNKTRL